MMMPKFTMWKPATKMTVAALSLGLLLPGCQSASAPGASNAVVLTPLQQTIREQSSRWNQTVATGAVTGAALGAGIGALAGGKNRGTAILVGGLAGAAAGGVAGTVVANNNLAFENRELSATQRIDAAKQKNRELNAAATTAEQLAQDNRAKLMDLNRQLSSGQITAAQRNAQIELMRKDLELLRRWQANGEYTQQSLEASSKDVPQLRAQIGPASVETKKIAGAVNVLDAVLRDNPTS